MKTRNVLIALAAVAMFALPAVAGPPGDECADAIAAGSAKVDTCAMTANAADPVGKCWSSGDGDARNGWYSFQATATDMVVTTDLNTPNPGDSHIAVYSGTCGGLTEIGCSEDIGPGNYNSEICVPKLTVGDTYYVQLGHWSAGACGNYQVDVSNSAGACANVTACEALPVDVPSNTGGDTNPATGAGGGGICGGFAVGAQYYSLIGTGNTITATLCTKEKVNIDAAMELLCESCSNPICVENDEDTCGPGGPNFSPEIVFCSEAGRQYWVGVGDNFAPQDTFNLDILDDGTPCNEPVLCDRICGDDVAVTGEQCDGTDNALCETACLPPGDPDECTCAPTICGNNILGPGEQCDGNADDACPGRCLPPGDPNECFCPTPECGNDVKEGGEQCDGTDALACKAGCQEDCTCAPFCGDGVVNGAEECDPPGMAGCPANGVCLANCSCGPSRPALPGWGLVGLGLVLLAGVMIVFGRRRTVAGI